MLGVSSTTIYCWETGRRTPTVDKLFELRDKIGLNLNIVER